VNRQDRDPRASAALVIAGVETFLFNHNTPFDRPGPRGLHPLGSRADLRSALWRLWNASSRSAHASHPTNRPTWRTCTTPAGPHDDRRLRRRIAVASPWRAEPLRSWPRRTPVHADRLADLIEDAAADVEERFGIRSTSSAGGACSLDDRLRALLPSAGGGDVSARLQRGGGGLEVEPELVSVFVRDRLRIRPTSVPRDAAASRVRE
jgi:hypothetical protein